MAIYPKNGSELRANITAGIMKLLFLDITSSLPKEPNNVPAYLSSSFNVSWNKNVIIKLIILIIARAQNAPLQVVNLRITPPISGAIIGASPDID